MPGLDRALSLGFAGGGLFGTDCHGFLPRALLGPGIGYYSAFFSAL